MKKKADWYWDRRRPRLLLWPKLLDRESAGEDAAVPQSALFFMTPLKAQTTFVSVTWKCLTKFISENFLLRLPHDRSSD